ncbi:hypothetical protein HaLaN_20595 [Haematococcus lacustris]|uniref:Uncharacterized protein n=1 Tax=Haematococcus lacustris TaxID=44745 RepID=A0A699ZLX5_HAELA|nr:hypothetical protein HaLaN_20595 [Haematococcus lacustris]
MEALVRDKGADMSGQRCLSARVAGGPGQRGRTFARWWSSLAGPSRLPAGGCGSVPHHLRHPDCAWAPSQGHGTRDQPGDPVAAVPSLEPAAWQAGVGPDVVP